VWLEDENVQQLEQLDVIPLDEEQNEQQEKPEKMDQCLPVLGERLVQRLGV